MERVALGKSKFKGMRGSGHVPLPKIQNCQFIIGLAMEKCSFRIEFLNMSDANDWIILMLNLDPISSATAAPGKANSIDHSRCGARLLLCLISSHLSLASSKKLMPLGIC
jgi:hypothetical protein